MRFLTKSLFKTGASCPTKLFYTKKPDRYPDANEGNEFMKSLAEGGYQVGTYAQLHFPGGIEITTRNKSDALAQTRELLERDSVVIYEAAIGHGPFYALVDILVKSGDTLTLIEVKSKQFNSSDSFTNKRAPNYLTSDWRTYLLDVAFQTWVATQEFPHLTIEPELMLLDGDATATINGLNTWFPIDRMDHGRIGVKDVPGRSIEALGESIMVRVGVGPEVARILSRTDSDPERRHPVEPESFEEWVHWLADAYVADRKITPALGAHCKSCEFRVRGKDSGFDECWGAVAAEPMVFDIWNFRNSAELIEQNIVLIDDPAVAKSFPPVQSALNKRDEPWTTAERQAIQIHLSTSGATKAVVHPGLFDAMRACAYPLHFIDFEAGIMSLPFHEGHGSYQKVAFQFSIHTLFEDGRLEHTHQWLSAEPGVDPNPLFARALKTALDPLQGTHFSYSHFEKSTMAQLREVLGAEPDLQEFIDRLEFTDMLVMLKHYYIHPLMGGSNSIKAVLPAVLGHDPYKALPPIPFTLIGDDMAYADNDDSGEVLNDGGKAMMAWAELQFADVPPARRRAVEEALLRYCELDTRAMAEVWLAWVALMNA